MSFHSLLIQVLVSTAGSMLAAFILAMLAGW